MHQTARLKESEVNISEDESQSEESEEEFVPDDADIELSDEEVFAAVLTSK